MGRTAKKQEAKQETLKCFYCENEYPKKNFYNSNSGFYNSAEKLPYCKQCLEKFYQYYFEKYTNDGCPVPERKAIKRLCMFLDIFYVDKVYNSAMDKVKQSKNDISPMSQYMRIIQLSQYNLNKETYENTIIEEEQEELSKSLMDISNISERSVDEDTIKFFGVGFTDDDYIFLKEQYDDWTARHECKTKAQEEVFKDICFNRLQNLKALRLGEDTKDITASFQKMLDSGKLQPKQNAGDTTADNQTFGTLIDKWENTRPLPEIDEELKDVDKIGWYVDVFFRGHLAKMMGLKNGLSNLYSKFISKYTVEKPEYSDEDNSEILFDTIFGNSPPDNDKVVV